MVDPRFIELLTKELTDGLTPVEKQELKCLLKQNSSHAKQREIIRDYWMSDKTEYKASAGNFEKIMAAIDKATRGAEDNKATELTTAPLHKLWKAWKYVAAVLVLGVAIYFSVNTAKEKVLASQWKHKITAPKIKERLVLSDGTIVTLNSGTKLSYPASFGSKNREVYLSGEAFFEVHKDSNHPFIIHTKKMNVRVLGTAFNIKSYDNEPESETSLIHGSIEVTLNDRASDRIILKPKEKLIVYNNLPPEIQTTKNVGSSNLKSADLKGTQYSLTNLTYLPNIDSSAVETLWLKNKLVFRNADFETLAADIGRWYGIKIVFQHEELKKLRFTAAFEQETVVQVLAALRLTEDFHYKQKDSIIYISK